MKPLDKGILIQYADMMEEIKDIRRRIGSLERSISRLGIVSDSVKGTRHDGTYGSIKITGYPTPEYCRKKVTLEKLRQLLDQKEAELLELTCRAEEYIENIERSELRIMFRLYFIDGLSDTKVARRMNEQFPRRRIKYTDENVKKRRQRFFDKI
ncbi:MAG: hypothetical protein RSB57_10730 [Hungatella sp.]